MLNCIGALTSTYRKDRWNANPTTVFATHKTEYVQISSLVDSLLEPQGKISETIKNLHYMTPRFAERLGEYEFKPV